MRNNYYDPFSSQHLTNYQQSKEAYINKIELETKQKKELLSIGFSLGFGIILCLVIQSTLSFILQMLGAGNLYKESFIFFTGFNAFGISVLSIALPFALIALFNRKKYREPIIPNKRIGFWKGFLWVNFGLIASTISNMFVGYIIVIAEHLGYKLNAPEGPQLNSWLGCITLIVSTAIMPAICEEFSMRCCALGLLKNHGKPFAIFAVSLIFGLMHGNIIQFIFAFIVGYILAYITIQTDSIIPAMLIHALTNGRSVIYDIVEFAIDTAAADKVISGITYYFIIAGGLCTVALLLSNSFKIKKDKNPNDVLPFGKKLLCILPGLAIPLIILILVTITTIEKM